LLSKSLIHLNFFNQFSWRWHKAERLVIYFFLLLLIILSVVFYKERVIFTDTVDVLIKVLKQKSLAVTTNRYTSIFGQFLPLAAFKLGLSLRLIVIAYSLNLILIPVVFCLASMFWFRETKTAWSILLFYTIMNARLFYFPVSEFQIGLCFLLFYVGLYQHYLKRKLNPYVFWVLSLGFIPTVIFSHPLSVPVLAAWIVLQFFINEKPWKATIGIGVLAVMAYALKKFFFIVPYDIEKKQGLERFNHFSLQCFDSRLANEFYKAVVQDYFFIPLLFLLTIAVLIYVRKYMAAALFILIVFALWVLVTVTFGDEPYYYYIEHMYQPVTFFLALAASRYVSLKVPRRLVTIILSVVLVVSINKIFIEKELLQRRLRWYEGAFELMDKKGIKKAIIGVGEHNIDFFKSDMWITVFESLILSSLKGPEHAKSITIVWNEEDARSVLDEKENLIGVALNLLPINELPSQYFHIGNGNYTMLSDIYTNEELRKLDYSKKR